MPRYFRQVAPGVFDIEDLKFRTNELAEFIQLVCAKHGVDQQTLVAVGYSNGANIAAGLILLKPSLLKRSILFRAMLPLVPDKLPELKGTSVFISGGKYDEIIPQKSTLELKDLLEKCGAMVEMNWERSTHALTSDEMSKAREWLLNTRV